MKCWRACNVSKNVLVALEVEIAETGWARLKGLIGRSAVDFPQGRGLWISPSQGVHTIGMSFPIDVVYLDSKGHVVKLYHRLAPFRVAALKLSARSVLELPAGTLARTQTEVGDRLKIRADTGQEE